MVNETKLKNTSNSQIVFRGRNDASEAKILEIKRSPLYVKNNASKNLDLFCSVYRQLDAYSEKLAENEVRLDLSQLSTSFNKEALEVREIKPLTRVVIRRLSKQNLKADNIVSLGSEGDVFINWIEDSSKSAVKGEHILELIAILTHLLTEFKNQFKFLVVSFVGDSTRAFRGVKYLGRLAYFLEENSNRIVFPSFLSALSDSEKNARTLLKTALGLVNIQDGDSKQGNKGKHDLESARICQSKGLNSLFTFSNALLKPVEMLLAEFNKSVPNLIDHTLDSDLINLFKNEIDPSEALRLENSDLRNEISTLTALLQQTLDNQPSQ